MGAPVIDAVPMPLGVAFAVGPRALPQASGRHQAVRDNSDPETAAQ